MFDILWMLFWAILGSIGIVAHWPLIIVVILFGLAGILFLPLDGNSDDWF